MSDVPAPVVQIQTVLFRNSNADVWRLLFGVAQTVAIARAEGHLAEGTWRLGDCSPERVLPAAEVAQLTERALREGLDAFSYEFFDENLGSSGGHNRLAANGEGTVIVTLNPDTYPSPRMLAELLATLRGADAGVVEARQLPMEHPKAYDLTTGRTSWASTCATAIPRPVFEELEGFDHDHFPLYCDDVDFSWRARYAGHEVVLAPRATVFHDKRPSAGGRPHASDVEVYHSTYGRLMLATRYGRKDIYRETVEWIERAGLPKQREALADIRAREAAGTMPAKLKHAERVAQFVDGEYAEHRF
ncbi:MAG: glycosyltransferase family 2 protein [Actinomycetota bacterium]|nr:glycosyltransferase family 2 protein [Actinomycetota bacterium]